MRKTQGFFLSIMIVLLALMGVIFRSSTVLAESLPDSPTPTPEGIEIEPEWPESECGQDQIFVMVDQSSSMKKNDPNELRISGALNIADILASNYLSLQKSRTASEQARKINISIIQFGYRVDEKHSVLDQPIMPSSQDEWSRTRKEIENKLNLGGVSLESTGFVDAFTKASEIANQRDNRSGSCPRRLAIVLTDGCPDAQGSCMTGEFMDDHFQQVEKLISTNFSAKNDRVYLTGLNAGGDDYWKMTGGYWRKLTKDDPATTPRGAQLVDTQPEIGSRLAEIIVNFIGRGVVTVKPGKFAVPPYLQSMRITFYPPSNTDSMTIKDPGGRILDESQKDILQTGAGTGVQVTEITSPPPGIYEILTSVNTQNVLITAQPLFFQSILLEPKNAVQQFTNVNMKAQLVDGNLNPMPSYPDGSYELTIKSAQLQGSDDAQPFSAAADRQTGMINANITPLNSNILGIYLNAIALDNQSNPWPILDGVIGNIQVDTVTFKPLDIQGGNKKVPTQFEPFTVSYQLINQTKQTDTVISLPVKWNITATTVKGDNVAVYGPDCSAFSEPDKSVCVKGQNTGLYMFKVLSVFRDPIDLNVEAFAIDNLTNQPVPMFKQSTRLDVAPLTFEASSFESITPGCTPTQFKPFSISLQMVDQQTQSNVQTPMDLTWDVNASDAQENPVEVKGPSCNAFVDKEKETCEKNMRVGKYTLYVKTDDTDDVTLKVKTSVTNPLDTSLVTFYENTFKTAILKGEKVVFKVDKMETRASPFLENLEGINRKLFGGSNQGDLYVGRVLFFWKQNLNITAFLQDSEQPGHKVTEMKYLPALKLVSQDGSNSLQNLPWQPVSDHFQTGIPKVGLGIYKLNLNQDQMPCELTVDLPTNIPDFEFVPDLFERIVIFLASLLLAWLIFLAIRELIFRFVNPLDGVLGVMRLTDNAKLAMLNIQGKSYWDYKFDRPQKMGYINRIRVWSWYLPKRHCIIEVTTIMPNGEVKEYRRNITNWSPADDIVLTQQGIRITWALRTQDLR